MPPPLVDFTPLHASVCAVAVAQRVRSKRMERPRPAPISARPETAGVRELCSLPSPAPFPVRCPVLCPLGCSWGPETSFAHPSLWRDIPRGAAAQSPHWAGHALAALMPGELQTWLTRGSQDCHPGHAGTACTLLKPEQNALRPNAVVAGSFPGGRHPALATRPSW